MTTPAILFSTVVGSHMWEMNHEGSDRDIMTCVVFPTEDILSGRAEPKQFAMKHLPEKGLDIQTGEIGKWIDQLISGNVNYIWGALSPVVEVGSPDLHRLRRIVLYNRSKATLASVRGLAASAIAQAALKGWKGHKQFNIAMRTIGFGISWIRGSSTLFSYRPFVYVPDAPITPQAMNGWYDAILRTLDIEEKKSLFPDRPDPTPFREFLLDLRLQHLDRKVLMRSNSA